MKPIIHPDMRDAAVAAGIPCDGFEVVRTLVVPEIGRVDRFTFYVTPFRWPHPQDLPFARQPYRPSTPPVPPYRRAALTAHLA